jgi:hypothetical protein
MSDSQLVSKTTIELCLVLLVTFLVAISCNGLGQAIAYRQVIEECNKLGGFYYHARVFECKEKKT